MCGPLGIDCSKKQKLQKEKCTILCEGIYADIRKDEKVVVDVDTPGMKKLVEAYERYKNQFQDEITYPPALMSIIHNVILKRII